MMAAADEAELTHMVATAAPIDDRPERASAIRAARAPASRVPPKACRWKSARAASSAKAPSIAILSFGTRLAEVLLAAEKLSGYGLSATIADARFAKPLDTDLIRRLAREHEVLITIEEGAAGGFGAHVMQFLAWDGAARQGLKIRPMILPDLFQDQDTPEKMYDAAGLDADGIVATVLSALGREQEAAAARTAVSG